MLSVADYAVQEILRDGGTVTIRAIRPDDKERLARMFAALEPRSIYMRFFHQKQELSEEDFGGSPRSTTPARPHWQRRSAPRGGGEHRRVGALLRERPKRRGRVHGGGGLSTSRHCEPPAASLGAGRASEQHGATRGRCSRGERAHAPGVPRQRAGHNDDAGRWCRARDAASRRSPTRYVSAGNAASGLPRGGSRRRRSRGPRNSPRRAT